METIAATVSAKYQIVIPKPVRESLRVRPHDTLLFLLNDGAAVLRPRPTNFTTAMRGLHKELWALTDDWLEEERDSWEE